MHINSKYYKERTTLSPYFKNNTKKKGFNM